MSIYIIEQKSLYNIESQFFNRNKKEDIMLSGFLKKLLFARQFQMNEGKIEVLGKQQIMLPSDILLALQSIDSKKSYELIKEHMKKNVEYYAKKIGASSSGMLKSMSDVFETFGLGKLQVVKLDNAKKSAVVRITNVPFAKECKGVKNCSVHNGAIAGFFSFFFKKDVECETKQCVVKNKKFCEFLVK